MKSRVLKRKLDRQTYFLLTTTARNEGPSHSLCSIYTSTYILFSLQM